MLCEEDVDFFFVFERVTINISCDSSIFLGTEYSDYFNNFYS